MKNNPVLFICFILLAGCTTVHVPREYVPGLHEPESNPLGSWMELTVGEGEMERMYAGELLCIEDNVLFLLAYDTIETFPLESINEAVLVTHRFGGPQFVIWGLLASVPGLIGAIVYPDWAGPFLVLAAVQVIPTTAATLINSFSYNKYVYPKRVYSIVEFRNFARFPQGLPPGLDTGDLVSGFEY